MQKKIYLYFLILLIVSCTDLDIGMQYQKISVIQKDSTDIYCYRLVWGIDNEAWYLSTNKEVCIGFDSTKDICFGKGTHYIYYKMADDTFEMYSNHIPAIPDKFPISIKTFQLSLLEANAYNQDFKNGKIKKIDFDSILLKTPCDPIPYSPVNNMKLKPR